MRTDPLGSLERFPRTAFRETAREWEQKVAITLCQEENHLYIFSANVVQLWEFNSKY